MKADNCILLSHVFIEPWEFDKRKIVEFSVKHWREMNPGSYIIVAGHGMRPDLGKFADEVIWDTEINREELGNGHARLVSRGLICAQKKGFSRVLKSRLDSIHLIRDIFGKARKLTGPQKLLVSQQTSLQRPKIGDLFLFGETEYLLNIFDPDFWYPTNGGNWAAGRAFLRVYDETDWLHACFSHLIFVDIFKIRWLDLHSNWPVLKNRQSDLLMNKLDDWYRYLWQTKEGNHVWDAHGNLIVNRTTASSEKEWAIAFMRYRYTVFNSD